MRILHPLFVHLHIAFLLMAFFAMYAWLFRGLFTSVFEDRLYRLARTATWLGVITVALSMVAGVRDGLVGTVVRFNGPYGGWLLSKTVRRQPSRVVVLGGGFAGLYAATYLSKADLPHGELEITLISGKNYFTFLPLLSEVVGGVLSREDVAFPLRAHARRNGFRFLRARVEGIDTVRDRVATNAGNVCYDYLVVALGAEPQYFGNEGLAQRTMPFVSIPHALAIRQHLLRSAEAAAERDAARWRGSHSQRLGCRSRP